MHAGIDDLLSARDGEPLDARTAQHIRECAHCTTQLNRLAQMRAELQRLPLVEAPASWSDIQMRLEAARAGRRGVNRFAAVAAVLVLAVCLGLFVQQMRTPEFAATPSSAATPTLTELAARSQQLESLLAALPQRPSIERVSTATTIDVIQHRIQQVDEQLAYAPDEPASMEHSEQLWRERVALMDSLVKVRYAEAQRVSF